MKANGRQELKNSLLCCKFLTFRIVFHIILMWYYIGHVYACSFSTFSNSCQFCVTIPFTKLDWWRGRVIKTKSGHEPVFYVSKEENVLHFKPYLSLWTKIPVKTKHFIYER